MIGYKVLCGAKKNAFILLLIFLILGLFISSAYLLLSKNTKKSSLVKDSSLNLGKIRNEKRRASPQLRPEIIQKETFQKIDMPIDEKAFLVKLLMLETHLINLLKLSTYLQIIKEMYY